MSQIIIPASQFRASNVRIIKSSDLSNIQISRENFIKNILRQYRGQTVQLALRYYDDFSDIPIDNDIIDDIPTNAFNSWWSSISTFFWPDSTTFVFNNPDTELLIMTANKVGLQNYDQFFLDGTHHCVFQPMINWAIDTALNTKTKSSERKYNAIVNKLEKLEEQFKGGVQEKDLQDICNKLQIGIQIDIPSTLIDRSTEFIKYRSQKKPLKTFKYINTRINHLELNEVINKNNYEEVSQEFLNNLVEQNIKEDKFCLWKGDRNCVYQVNTLHTLYKLSEDEGYQKEFNDFSKLNNLDQFRIEHFSNKPLSEFLLSNLNNNNSIIFNNPYQYNDKQEYFEEYIHDVEINLDDEIKDLQKQKELDLPPLAMKEVSDRLKVIDYIKNFDNLNHIDMKKAYTQGNNCSHYKGYLGKITDFRTTDKIMGLGIYQIKNIKNIPEIIKKLQVLHNNNCYSSPELEYYQSLGITFDIVGGCWGIRTDIKFTEGMYQKNNGVKNYCRWYGCLMKLSKKERYNFTCKNLDYAKLNNMSSKCDIRYNEYKDQGIIEYNKERATHSAQIAIFIHSYCRISMIEQLLKFKDINQVIAVQVDGIYYTGDVEVGDLFYPDKEGKGIKYIQGTDYVEDHDNEIFQFSGKNRENNRIEVHTGAGGCGKTYNNMMDKGFQYPLYVAPSWKLARNKQKEFNIDSTVFYYLLSQDPELYKPIMKKYNTIIIDEISMLLNSEKYKIIHKFKNHKIIFCGDLGYQLPPVPQKGIPLKEFEIGDLKHIKYRKNHRCQCEKLQKLLLKVRKVIRKSSNDNIPKELLDSLNIIDKDTIDYKVEDLIISKTHINKDYFTNKYKNMNKYYVKENTRDFSNGEIVIGVKPDNCDSDIRHGFTIHSVQGETASHKLYIDMRKMTSLRMWYTAISRVKRYDQLIFIQ